MLKNLEGSHSGSCPAGRSGSSTVGRTFHRVSSPIRSDTADIKRPIRSNSLRISQRILHQQCSRSEISRESAAGLAWFGFLALVDTNSTSANLVCHSNQSLTGKSSSSWRAKELPSNLSLRQCQSSVRTDGFAFLATY